MNNGNQVGLITEQGDMGLGFDPLSQKDQQALNEQSHLKESKDSDDGEKNGIKAE